MALPGTGTLLDSRGSRVREIGALRCLRHDNDSFGQRPPDGLVARGISHDEAGSKKVGPLSGLRSLWRDQNYEYT